MIQTLYNGGSRMKNVLTALALWMALCAGAFAQVRNATVTYTYLGVQLRGYRVGEEFMIPLDRIVELGWSANSSPVGAKISAEGNTERDVLLQLTKRFKSIVQEFSQKQQSIPWIDPPEAPRPGEMQRFIPIHL